MKSFIAVLIAASVGFGSAWVMTSRRHETKVAQIAATEAGWQNEKAFLEQSLAEAKKRHVEVRTVTRTTEVTNRLAASEILERLTKLNPRTGSESRTRTFRKIVHHLQMLVELDSEALPVIHDFLKQNIDVDYASDVLNEAGERVSRGGFASRSVARTDFLVPPSMRLGLVDVLAQIGGEEAQGILAGVLDTTGRGVEVAYIARVLQDEVPGKFRENALKAARDLLANPPAYDQPNRLDENARAYLYQVLSMYNDTTFAQNAQTLLITPEGRVDRQAMNYLSSTLKDQAVPSLYAAYKDPRVTNVMERANIMSTVLNYAGPVAQANDLFKEIISDDSIPSGVRAFTIQGLAGGAGKEKPSDPKRVQARLQLLYSVRGSFTDERLLRSMDETRTALEGILAGSPPNQ
jgi:hypothetical protein